MASRSSIRAKRNVDSGFTLVEISLAVGIFAFAIVAIMALFPVGLRSANDSRAETIVTQIARTVMSDLRTGTFKTARVATSATPTFITTDLSAPAPAKIYLLYTATGKPKSISSVAKYNSGDSSGDFIVTVSSQTVATTAPVLAQVTVSVESPAAAPVASRSKYPVITLMGDTR